MLAGSPSLGCMLTCTAAVGTRRQGKRTRLPVTFLFIPEEEVGSPTSRARIEEAARGHKYALVMEPGRDGDKVVTSRKGVGRFTLTVRGKAAHAGVRHQDGRSAILEMAKQILRIEDKTDYARGITCNVGLIKGGSGVNVTPAECSVEVDLRVPNMALAEEMTHWFLGLEPIGHEVTLAVEGGMNRPPYQKDAGIADLFGKAQAIYREIGKELADDLGLGIGDKLRLDAGDVGDGRLWREPRRGGVV